MWAMYATQVDASAAQYQFSNPAQVPEGGFNFMA